LLIPQGVGRGRARWDRRRRGSRVRDRGAPSTPCWGAARAIAPGMRVKSTA